MRTGRGIFPAVSHIRHVRNDRPQSAAACLAVSSKGLLKVLAAAVSGCGSSMFGFPDRGPLPALILLTPAAAELSAFFPAGFGLRQMWPRRVETEGVSSASRGAVVGGILPAKWRFAAGLRNRSIDGPAPIVRHISLPAGLLADVGSGPAGGHADGSRPRRQNNADVTDAREVASEAQISAVQSAGRSIVPAVSNENLDVAWARPRQ